MIGSSFNHDSCVDALVERTRAEIRQPVTDALFQELLGVSPGPFWAVSFLSREENSSATDPDKAVATITLVPIDRPGDRMLEMLKLESALKGMLGVTFSHIPPREKGGWDEAIILQMIYQPSQLGEKVAKLAGAILTQDRMKAGWYKPTFPDGTYIHDHADGQPVVVVRIRWKTLGQDQYEKTGSGLLFVPRDSGFTAAGRLPHNFCHIATVIASSPEGLKAGLHVGAQVIFKQTHLARWQTMGDSTILGWVPIAEVLGFYEETNDDLKDNPFGPTAEQILT